MPKMIALYPIKVVDVNGHKIVLHIHENGLTNVTIDGERKRSIMVTKNDTLEIVTNRIAKEYGL